jgi:hypothetical protein
MGVDYGWEKFFSSLNYAVANTDSLQKRLAGVAMGVCHLDRDSFPDDETWKRFENFMNVTTLLSAKGNEGTIQATTSEMSDGEAHQWLQEALGLFSELAEAYGRQFGS